MIKVGITENVVLKSAEITDKGHLSLLFKELNAAASTVDLSNPFAVAASGDAIDASTDAKLLVMALLVPKEVDSKGVARTRQQRGTLANNDLNETLNKLKHILSQYTTAAEISAAFKDIYAGTGFTMQIYNEKGPDSFYDVLLTKERLDIVSKNLFESFISVVTKFLDQDSLPMRIRLCRQNAEKHYATLPGAKFVESYPFFETMSVPAEASKLKFSDYEKKLKLDDPTPSSITSADATTQPPANTAPGGAAANVFGNR
jgi:hypothetical protein